MHQLTHRAIWLWRIKYGVPGVTHSNMDGWGFKLDRPEVTFAELVGVLVYCQVNRALAATCHFGFIKLASQRLYHMTVLRVIVVNGAIKTGLRCIQIQGGKAQWARVACYVNFRGFDHAYSVVNLPAGCQ